MASAPRLPTRLKAGEPYARARITDSNGKMAWTHPLFAELRR
jgi:hypothetical protein